MVRLLPIAVLLLGLAGCSKPVGGLLLLVTTSDQQEKNDVLQVQVGPVNDGGMPYTDPNQAYSLPSTFAIMSNGDPDASVSIVLSVSNQGTSSALQTLRYVVESIPTNKFEELEVVFGGTCTSQGLADGGTGADCCPAMCHWANGACTCDAGALPLYPFEGDASEWASMPATDAGSPPDARDGGTDGGGGSVPDAAVCEAGAVQCKDTEMPQQCARTGQWTDEPQCAQGDYCFQGSCIPAPTSCVVTGNFADCESYEVTGGPFLRSDNTMVMDASAPATLSTFRLDAFEVDVRRFQQFVDAVVTGYGWPLQAGTGRHSYLPGGGLNGGGDGGAYETGWDPSWDGMFPNTVALWTTNLYCSDSPSGTNSWEPEGQTTDPTDIPMNCVTWYEAYAFCIWDGGFLPSEAEWNYAAAGGNDQRLYPWGSTDPGAKSQYAIWACFYPPSGGTPCQGGESNTSFANIAPVGYAAKGVGRYGQSDLAGNVAEWTLDSYDSTYPTPCHNCTALPEDAGAQRVYRGGSFDSFEEVFLYTSTRIPVDPANRSEEVGFRCARGVSAP
jgi:sulfatase modifying factor 1